MPSASEQLAALGLVLPPVVAPVAAYVPALVHGKTVWTSGQLPMVDGQLVAAGVVSNGAGDVTPDVAHECARICALNGLAAIADAAGGIDAIERIIRVTGYVASAPGFTGQPTVINGASLLLGEVFGEAGKHARSAVGVAALPLGAPVEVEIEAVLR